MIFKEMLLRILIVFFLSALYGIQRQKSHKPVGFGTFIFVSLGSCALALTAVQMALAQSISLLSAIVTGIGFLGAGALIKGSDRIFGFTTAASIWLFAIFGLIIGIGYYIEGFLVYALVWVVVAFDSFLEKRGIGSYKKKVTIIYSDFSKRDEMGDILAKYSDSFNLISINVNKNDKTISSTYLVEGVKKEIEDLLKELYKRKWCVAVKFE